MNVQVVHIPELENGYGSLVQYVGAEHELFLAYGRGHSG